MVEEVLKVEEEVVVLNVALEAAVVQNQDLLLIQMVRRPQAMVGTLLLPLRRPMPTEGGTRLLRPKLPGVGMLRLLTAMPLHLQQKIG